MVVSKSRSSASLTVITPARVDGERRWPSVSPSVLPAVTGTGRCWIDLLCVNIYHGGVVGSRLGEVGRGVGDRRRDVGDGDRDVLGVGLGGLVGRLVAEGVLVGLEVEVVGVADGDHAGARVDGERRSRRCRRRCCRR